MVTLNSQVRIQTKTGGDLGTVSLNGFWSIVNGGSGAFDPKIVYDPYANHFVFVAVDDAYSPTAGILLGISQTSDPTGTWYLYRISNIVDSTWFDYPSIGFNNSWVVVSTNMYTTGGSYNRWQIYAFDKADLYGGLPVSYIAFLDYGGGTTWAPAVTYSPTLNTMYLLQTYSSASGLVRLATITGAVGSEVMSTDTLGNYNVNYGSSWSQFPAGGADFAPQLGSAQLIQTNDARMQNLVYRNGQLWAAHTVFLPSGGSPTRSAVQWWQISPNSPPATPPTATQKGRIEDPSGVLYYAFPSIAANQNNDALIGFSSFSANQYASASYAFRAATDPLDTFQSVELLKAGEAPYYKIYGGTRNRWGDYSNTYVDPANDTDFWTIQEYAETPSGGYDRWGTWWGKILPLGQFNKLTPANGAVGTPSNPTLTWQTSTYATSYEYCIDTSNNNTCNATWISTGANTNVNLTGLLYGTTYYWHVRSNNGGSTLYSNNNAWWSFTTLPSPFNKLTPANGAVGVGINLTLTWETSVGATGYEYCIDTSNNNTCNATWISTGVNTNVNLTGLLYGTTYYWHVRASTGGGITYSDGNANVWWSFITSPGPFYKLTPVSGAGGIAINPTLTWGTSAGATGYEYCIDTSNNNTCNATWISTGANTSVNLTGLLYSTTYYWHVRSSMGGGITYSNGDVWWSFTTIPDPFGKLTPLNGANNVATNPTLTWEVSTGATSYEYCIDTSNNNTCNATWISTGTNTSVSLTGLLNSTTHYWHVRANSAAGTTYSNGDTWWNFTTIIDLSITHISPSKVESDKLQIITSN